jgi:hypothetical protein
MQSQLGKAQTVRNDAKRAACGMSAWVCGLAYEQSVLLGPVERQIEFSQTRRGELDGLSAL